MYTFLYKIILYTNILYKKNKIFLLKKSLYISNGNFDNTKGIKLLRVSSSKLTPQLIKKYVYLLIFVTLQVIRVPSHIRTCTLRECSL